MADLCQVPLDDRLGLVIQRARRFVEDQDPRVGDEIGQEVVVIYVEGDPDRPLITGCVYNAEQMPAYKPDDKKTMTCFKSNSSPGGSGFNEIRLDDTAGKEELYIHAQYDMDTLIEHDMKVVFDFAQRITVLDYGSVLAEGTPAEIRASPEVRRRYLGEAIL